MCSALRGKISRLIIHSHHHLNRQQNHNLFGPLKKFAFAYLLPILVSQINPKIVSVFQMQTINFRKFFSGRRRDIYLGRGGKYSEGRGIKDGLVLGALKPHLTHPFGLAISHHQTNNKGKSFGTNAFNCA